MVIVGGMYVLVGVYSFIMWDWTVIGNVHHWFNPATHMLIRIIMIVLFPIASFIYWVLDKMCNPIHDITYIRI